jgi:hypothetical protein
VLNEEKFQEIGARRENSLKNPSDAIPYTADRGFVFQACNISEEVQYKILRRHECVLNHKEHFQQPLPG